MNQFLNQNANEIIEEMKPAASAAIGKHFKSFLNGAFLQVPIPIWLKDTYPQDENRFTLIYCDALLQHAQKVIDQNFLSKHFKFDV